MEKISAWNYSDPNSQEEGTDPVRLAKQACRINLALQGGGAHGAFTWGVLDRLLQDPSLKFGWISGTSAGAINAVAMAAGLMEGGPSAAREKLTAVWTSIGKAGVPDIMWNNPLMKGFAASLSPYEFNPLGFDPLRKLLTDNIDFEKLRQASPVELLIAATDISTGRARLFRTAEMTVEAVLASACLPTIHHAVEIDGNAYWDGAFSANPDLVTLASESPTTDTLIVQISPLGKVGVPKSQRDISAQVNRVTFNAPLLRDVEYIEAMRAAVNDAVFARNGKAKRLASHRFHIIDAGEHTSELTEESKMSPGTALLSKLHTAGHDETTNWLQQHRTALGKKSSVDLNVHFLGAKSGTATTETDAQEIQVAAASDTRKVTRRPHRFAKKA
jgi:NTE family protein